MIYLSLIGFITSCALLFIFMPWVRQLSHRIGAIAVPNHRSMHKHPMPRLGGLAIFLSFVGAYVLIYPAAGGKLSIFTGLMVSAALIEIVGVIDDKYEISAKFKLLGQVTAASAVYLFGVQIDYISIPFSQFDISLHWLSFPITVLWIVGVTNAINLIDGLDGLATGVSAIATATIMVIALLSGNIPVFILCGMLLGSLVGFLFFNFLPAKIFMGESGSAFLGFFLAALSVYGFKQAASVSFVIPLAALGLPLSDTVLAIIRRKLRKVPIFSADTGHLHHSLVNMGLTPRNAVFTIYCVSFIFGLSAVLLFQVSSYTLVTVLIMLLLLFILLLGAELVGIVQSRPVLLFFRKLFWLFKQKG